MFRRVFLCLAVGGCATAAGSGHHDSPDAREQPGTPDARETPGTPDAPEQPGTPDAAPTPTPDAPPQVTQSSLLLSEVQLAPTGGEFIEIVNPTASAVSLDHYYVSDVGTYWKLPAGTQTVDSGDFIVQFKAGSSIPAKGVITIATDTAANFKTTNGVSPTYSIADGTVTVVASNSTPTLTNAGEMVVLFTWDGASDLVTDVDLMIAGAASSTNTITPKSGMSVDGPDADSIASTYKTDLDSIAVQGATPASAKSTKRLMLETGHEMQQGSGNGSDGDDETSEATGTTWDTTFSAPTPGTVPSTLTP